VHPGAALPGLAPFAWMSPSEDVIPGTATGWSSASARARALGIEAVALGAKAHERRRSRQLRGIVGRAERIARELRALDHEIDLWDGVHPPLSHLAELLETVEADLQRLETDMQALRPRDAG
jgi:FAD/FMN-containing dehydrogenase